MGALRPLVQDLREAMRNLGGSVYSLYGLKAPGDWVKNGKRHEWKTPEGGLYVAQARGRSSFAYFYPTGDTHESGQALRLDGTTAEYGELFSSLEDAKAACATPYSNSTGKHP
jgi:hypothetical protein